MMNDSYKISSQVKVTIKLILCSLIVIISCYNNNDNKMEINYKIQNETLISN